MFASEEFQAAELPAEAPAEPEASEGEDVFGGFEEDEDV